MGTKLAPSKSAKEQQQQKGNTKAMQENEFLHRQKERRRMFTGASYILAEMAAQLGTRFLFSVITRTHEEVCPSTIVCFI